MKKLTSIILVIISVLLVACGGSSSPSGSQANPVIHSISPNSGGNNTVVTILGSNFGDAESDINRAYYCYYLNGKSYESQQKLSSNRWTNTSISVRLYETTLSQSPKGYFKVSVDGVESNLSSEFSSSLLNPPISSISPTSGRKGTLLTIRLATPTELLTNPDTSFVTFFELSNIGVSAKSNLFRDSDLTYSCYVPELSISRDGYVGIQIGNYSLTSTTMRFRYPNPEIDYISPPEGDNIGALITINGSDFGDEKGTVTIGGRYVTVFSWQDTEIKVRIPVDSTKGNNTVEVIIDNEKYSYNFIVAAPEISYLTPSGVISEGDSVTLQGRYFGSQEDEVTQQVLITFDDGYYSQPANFSDTSISFIWPVENSSFGNKTAEIVVNVGGLESNKITVTAD